LARYWAEELAKQSKDLNLKQSFADLAKDFKDKESVILKELIDCQGKPMDLGGYYHVNREKTDKLMQPSSVLNAIVARLAQ